MTVIVMPDGRRFRPVQWHDAHIRTIPHHTTAVASCRACGSLREIPAEVIRTDANSSRSISQAAARLRCSSCGARDADLMFGDYGGEPPAL
jgi:hypothetical protein